MFISMAVFRKWEAACRYVQDTGVPHHERLPLQELQRYTDESDADRGDSQRAGHFYRELVSHCLEVRRKKEMEMEVMLGNIKDWPDDVPSVQTFGPIILMENVIVMHSPEGDVHQKDCYVVLFERDLLLLSISREMTSFRFETRIPVRDLTLPRTPRANQTQNSSPQMPLRLPEQEPASSRRDE